MALEEKDLVLLNKPFVASDHKFLNDLIYLHEEPIAERLDLVDPAWSFQIQSITTRPNAGEGGKDVATVTVHASLIVKGVARHGVGMAVVQKTNPIAEVKWENNVKKNTGNFYTNEANEAEKSAVTDALKRCARMFGIGRYLLTIPKGTVKDVKQLEKWLKDTYGDFQKISKPVYHDESPVPASEADPLDPDTYLGKEEDSNVTPDKKWFITVMALTKPFYSETKHQENSLNKAWREKLIHGSMLPRLAAITMLLHRIEEDKKLSPEEAKSLVIAALGGGVNDWMKKNKDNFAKAWEIVQNYITQASQQEIPF